MRRSSLWLLWLTLPAVAQVESLVPIPGEVPKELQLPGQSADVRKPVAQGKIAEALRIAFGNEFGGEARDANGQAVVKFGETEILLDDGRQKTVEEKLEAADVEDMFAQVYPLGDPWEPVAKDWDPGRVRVDGLFKALYGANEEAVTRNLVTVNFCGHKVRFNERLGAAKALEAVGVDFENEIARKPELRVFIKQLSGTFNWRPIAGTNRLSAHCFGIAIDLNTEKSHYWRWDTPEKMETFSRKSWPVEIIRTFEKHGFVWGGRWYHYDTMHFEYRPEMIAYSKLMNEEEKAD